MKLQQIGQYDLSQPIVNFPELKVRDGAGKVYAQFVPIDDITTNELCLSMAFLLYATAGQRSDIIERCIRTMPKGVSRHWDIEEPDE